MRELAAFLASKGFVAAEEEATELLTAANGDLRVLQSLVDRRLTGEPLAWIVGSERFYGLRVLVGSGVYVPRPHSEELVRRAVLRLPRNGTAIDLCTGSGALAAALQYHRTDVTVVASDVDERAVACARANNVDAHVGDLFDPFENRRVDLVMGVLPYVPTDKLSLLQRDTFAHESPRSYDGGPGGLDVVKRALRESVRHLLPGGVVLFEIGAGQLPLLKDEISVFECVQPFFDHEGDIRGFEASLRKM